MYLYEIPVEEFFRERFVKVAKILKMYVDGSANEELMDEIKKVGYFDEQIPPLATFFFKIPRKYKERYDNYFSRYTSGYIDIVDLILLVKYRVVLAAYKDEMDKCKETDDIFVKTMNKSIELTNVFDRLIEEEEYVNNKRQI